MGVDQLISGGDVDNPTFDSLEAESVNTDALSHGLEDGIDISASRSFNTEYQNTTGETVLLIVQFLASASGDNFDVALEVSNTSGLSFSPDVQSSQKRTSDGSSDNVVLSAIVPDGAYYKVEAFPNNDSTINAWFERRYV